MWSWASMACCCWDGLSAAACAASACRWRADVELAGEDECEDGCALNASAPPPSLACPLRSGDEGDGTADMAVVTAWVGMSWG